METATRVDPKPQLIADVMSAMAITQLPDVHWIAGDDLCDCTFQQVAEWTNPYIASTLRVRMCCIWAAIFKQYPQFVQEIPAYYDQNRNDWTVDPIPWDSEEMDMPVYLWLRQMAVTTGRSVSEVREEYVGRYRERPRAVPVGSGMQSRTGPDEETQARSLRERLTAAGWYLPQDYKHR